MSHKRVAILISGGGSNMLALVDSMTGDHPARPCLVFSNDPNARGLTLAAERGVATAALDHRPFKGDRPAFEAEITRLLEAAGTEIVCLAGFMRVLTNGFVSHWQGRMLNIHPALLPSYRGLHTHERAIEDGVKIHGCTVHFVVPEMDAGPIILQAAVPVEDSDDAETLAARVLKQEHRIYPQALALVAAGRVRISGNRVLANI